MRDSLIRDDRVVSIVGGGTSMREVDHAKIPGTVIAVNDAGIHLQRRVDAILSMDRLWTEHRWPWLREHTINFWGRPNCLQNVDWKGLPWVHRYDNDETSTVMSETHHRLNGTNSGMVALNLAYTMRPKLVLLFGFDMTRNNLGVSYWYPPYPWAPKGATPQPRYAKWAKQFESVAGQFANAGIHVINANPKSAMTAFERMSLDAALEFWAGINQQQMTLI